MKIIHKVFANEEMEFKSELDMVKISYKYEESIVGRSITFEINENHTHWPHIKKLIKKHNISDYVYTKFSTEELHAASFLGIMPSWHYGYPMPDDDFGYLGLTYDLSRYCENCGM